MRRKGDISLYQKPRSTQFTKAGFDELQGKYDTLKKERPDAVMNLKKSRELGDLSENGYYKASRQRLSFIDRELGRIGLLLKYAVIVERNNNGRVGLGSKVLLKTDSGEVTYTISGKTEANPGLGKISLISPLGKSLMGKSEGETVIVSTPGGNTEYLILNIEG